MGGYRRIPKEIKDEILSRVKQGHKTAALAAEYGVSIKTIYTWLSAGVQAEVSALEYARLKRERDDLLRLVGNLTLEVEKRKKNHRH
jgi:transposase-like protein